MLSKYNIFALCNACGDVHRTGDAIILQSGPRQKQSVSAFAGKELPSDLAALKNSRVSCPRTGRHYAQTDYKQIFLVPIGLTTDDGHVLIKRPNEINRS
jgi:hypothetical protein